MKNWLRKSWQQLIEITRLGGTTTIVIVVRITERIPPLDIPADMIKDAAELGAIIDIPCYDYREDDETTIEFDNQFQPIH